MDKFVVKKLIHDTLAGKVRFPALLSALMKEGVDSYHVDLLRSEMTFYAAQGDTFIIDVRLEHPGVAARFSQEAMAALLERSQEGRMPFPDFAKEAAAIGCAYYLVYLTGKKVRYLGRHGEEHLQVLP